MVVALVDCRCFRPSLLLMTEATTSAHDRSHNRRNLTTALLLRPYPEDMNLSSMIFIACATVLLSCQGAITINPPVTPPAPPPTTPPPPSPPLTNLKPWSDPATWGGTLPQAGQDVTIPAGLNVLLDVSPPNLKSLTILGALQFAERDLELQAGHVMLHGTLRIGESGKPFGHKATITLTATDTAEDIMGMGTRGILVMGGKLELNGTVPNRVWTKLNDHAQAGTNNLKLVESVNWKPGDRIVVAPTDFYNDGQFVKTAVTEQLEVSGVTGDTINLKTPLQKFRWGKLQYATNAGMSLTPGPITLPDTQGKPIPTILDERAEVGNLSRNIVIQSADDSLWKTQGFGAQLMVMDRSSSVQLNGVELRRVGQAGKFGRYPIHFHNLSYDASGTVLGDTNGTVQNSVIWNSSQRCAVIHGTNGVTLRNNICFDIQGHAIFVEDAVERRNLIEGNLVLKVRNPARPLLKHEDTSSGLWLTNPDNTVRNNAVADVSGHGYWLAFPRQTLGPNKNVKLLPDHMALGVFEDNVVHSVGADGLHLDNVPKDSNVGNLEGNKYSPTVNGSDYDYQNGVRFTVARITSYKNGAYWGGGGGMWNRNTFPDYLEWVSADHMGESWFAGAGDNGLIARSLVIGTSLNNATPRHHNKPLSAIASYHSTFDITQNVIMNFPFTGTEPNPENKSIGAFKTADYYITAVDKGLIRNADNTLINAHPGRRVQPFTAQNWTLAGALWDPHGYWGARGNYWVYDTPFFTAGTSCTAVTPIGLNGSSCAGPYYGVGDYLTDFDTNRYSFKHPIEVTRLDASGGTVGTWAVGDGNTAPMLGNMRHFAGLKGGRFVLRFPDRVRPSSFVLPRDVSMSVTNFLSSNDWMLLGVSFDGSQDAAAFLSTRGRHEPRGWNASTPSVFTQQARFMVAGASIDAVLNDAQGKTFYQDKPGNLVWVKLMGGLPSGGTDPNPNSDANLYKVMELVVCKKHIDASRVCAP